MRRPFLFEKILSKSTVVVKVVYLGLLGRFDSTLKLSEGDGPNLTPSLCLDVPPSRVGMFGDLTDVFTYVKTCGSPVPTKRNPLERPSSPKQSHT